MEMSTESQYTECFILLYKKIKIKLEWNFIKQIEVAKLNNAWFGYTCYVYLTIRIFVIENICWTELPLVFLVKLFLLKNSS